jgi:hypothetical protein
MKFVEAKIASAEDVRAALRAGIEVNYCAQVDEFAFGWRLEITFTNGGQRHCYTGRLFRVATNSAAANRAKIQLKRLIES